MSSPNKKVLELVAERFKDLGLPIEVVTQPEFMMAVLDGKCILIERRAPRKEGEVWAMTIRPLKEKERHEA